MDEVVDIELQVEALGGLGVRVLELRVEESLFDVYRVSVDALIEGPPDLDEIIGDTASVKLTTRQGRERYWHGLVWSAQLKPRLDHDASLRVIVAPQLRILSLGRDSRIFRDQSVPAVVEDVLHRGGLTSEGWDWHLTERLPPHRNIHQYNESDYDFVRRLLAEEGVSFAIQNDVTAACVRFFDSASGLGPIPESDALHYQPDRLNRLDGVFELRERLRVRPGSTTLRDFDFEHPEEDLHLESESQEEWGPDVYLHPGGFEHADMHAGARRAQRYLEGLRLDRRRISGRSDVPFMEAGRLFHIQGHERIDLNDSLLVVDVAHRCWKAEGERGAFAFENEFHAIPAATPHRPSPLRARPRAPGLQTAFVTVPDGLDHHCDVFGRAKVRFPWDRSGITDAENSTWVRVGQLQLPGALILPRRGFEVHLDFEQGDWDRPCIVGHGYNAEALVPYPLPDRAPVSSWQSDTLYGGPLANEVRFDDTAGSEEMFLHASMNMRKVVEHDSVLRVTTTENVRVGIHQALTVTGDYTSVVGGGRTTSVGRTQALRVDQSVAEGVGGSERVTANRRRLEVGGDLVESVGGDLTRTIGPLYIVGALRAYAHRTLGDSLTTVGALLSEQVGKDRLTRVRGDLTESVAALKHVEAGSVRISTGAGLEATLADLELEVAEDRSDSADNALELSAGGDMALTAKQISVTASNQLTISAGSCEITLSASGQVSLRAPRVNLRNADSIGSQVQVN